MFHKSYTVFRKSCSSYIRIQKYFASLKVPDDAINLSNNCVQKLKQLCDGDKTFLRLCVESGGCSGFQYKFHLDDKIGEDDRHAERINEERVTRQIYVAKVCGSIGRGHPKRIYVNQNSDKPKNCDIINKIFKRDGVQVVVDETSLEYIKGSTIDYHTELIRSTFRVVQNPNADIGCSCGASFAIKID